MCEVMVIPKLQQAIKDYDVFKQKFSELSEICKKMGMYIEVKSIEWNIDIT